MPRVVALLIGMVAAISIVSAVLGRNGPVALGAWLYLWPPAVLQGQVWRLVTWPFLENDPIGLLFGCYMLFWVGRDLVDVWGSQRFLFRVLILALLAGGVTTALALVWPGLGAQGLWPIVSGLIVMWGLSFRNRAINWFGLLSLTGVRLAQIAVGITVLYALFVGLKTFVPHFAAQGIAYLWMVPLARWQGPRKPKKRAQPQGNGQVFSFADWHEEHNRTKKN